MNRKLLPALLLPLLMAASASPALPRGFAGLSFGLSEAEFELASSPTLETVPVDDRDTSWKLFAGFGTRYVGLDVAWIDFGRWTGTVNDVVAEVSVDARARGLDLELYGRLPLGKRTALFGKAGALIWDSDKTTTSVFDLIFTGRQVVVRQESPRGAHASWGLGAEFRAVGPLWVRVEYQDFGASGGAGDLRMATVGLVVELGGRSAGAP